MSEPQAMRIGVAGAGIIGLSCAFELLRREHKVTLFDARPATASTSWAAAGMLGPAYEMFLHEEDAVSGLSDLCFDSAKLWPDFARIIRAESGLPVGHRTEPTLALARDETEQSALERLRAALVERDESATWLGASTARQRFGLAHDVIGALQIEGDHQVDNRKLLTALQSAVQALGGKIVRGDVDSMEEARQQQGAEGLDRLIWARGRRETGVTSCVKGQALSLERLPGMSDHVFRFGSTYIVPKADRVIIGATSEPVYSHAGIDRTTIDELHAEACHVMPKLKSAARLEAWSGLRPKSDDGLPVLARLNEEEFVAAGHFRHGILLAPITANKIADLVEDRTPATATR